jgi:hypothetical protein
MIDSGADVKPASAEPRGKRTEAVLALLILFYLIVWFSTRAHFMADTNVYAQAILRHQNGISPIDYRLTTANPFWDFGHILWRPLGWLSFVLTKPAMDLATRHNDLADVILTLMGINFLAAAAGVVFFFLLAGKILHGDWTALLATIGFFSADAFLNYAHTGNAYVPGLACLTTGMYLALPGKLPNRATRRAILAGVCFALSVLFWLPYVFVLPAALVLPLGLYGYETPRLRLSGYTIGTCAVIGVAAYIVGVYAAGIHTFADLKAWVLASGHGHIQPGGLRAWARLAFAVPRSFINMGLDGMWLKRYLVHDPYAPVTIANLFRLSLWKLGMFYVATLGVCLVLYRTPRGRGLLFYLAAAVVPILAFAVFIFEAGSIERYLPLYPFVFLAFGFGLDANGPRRLGKTLLFVTLVVTLAVNILAMSNRTVESQRTAAIARIHDLIPLLPPHSLIMAVNEQDSLAEFRQNFPLDPINLNAQWGTYDVLEINTERLATWQQDFANRVLKTWERGGSVWIPLRFLQARPRPEWNWVEGDDKRVKWTDLPAYFSQFETATAVDGADGFLLLQESQKNRTILERSSQTRSPNK